MLLYHFKTITKMPKKKIQHKGKPKHATEECEDVIFRKNDPESIEEEYTTVTDFETNKKYSKRLIENNWAKYEANLSDFNYGDEGNEPPKTDDFNSLLKTASSDCSHFQFSSEKLWKSENNSVPASKIFDLDVNILSSGLACVPFYERLGLDEKELSADDKERFDKAAENSWKHYNSVREKSVKKPEGDLKPKNQDSGVHNLEESLKVKLDSDRYSEEDVNNKNLGIQGGANMGGSKKDVEICNEGDKVGKSKQKIFFSENDENLEDWLDSVLDD